MNARLFAVIPCAGVGARVGADVPKQYHPLAGRTLLYHTLSAFDACTELAQTLVVIARNDAHFDARRLEGLRFLMRRCGGADRQISVLNGLYALAEFGARDDDWVLVHDGARPGVTPALIRTLIDAVRNDPVGGIVALPLTDTLKRAAHVDGALTPPRPSRIARTEPRAGLWLAQTPQMFRLGVLRSALADAQRAGHTFPDEASALEALGYAPQLVVGHPRNFKVTYADDFEWAQALLSCKKRSI